jgi:hypothetical protein
VRCGMSATSPARVAAPSGRRRPAGRRRLRRCSCGLESRPYATDTATRRIASAGQRFICFSAHGRVRQCGQNHRFCSSNTSGSDRKAKRVCLRQCASAGHCTRGVRGCTGLRCSARRTRGCPGGGRPSCAPRAAMAVRMRPP